MEFDRVVRRRRMVRTFTGRSVEPEQLERVLDAGRRGPSAGFSQGQSFVVLTNREVIDRCEAAQDGIFARYGLPSLGNALPMWEAPVHIVVCTSESTYRQRYSREDKRLPDGTRIGDIEWPVPYWYLDAGAAVMLLLLATVDEGLDACFHGFPDWGPLKEVLAIPAGVEPVGIVSLGHGAGEPPPRRKHGRRPLEEVVHRNRWEPASR